MSRSGYSIDITGLTFGYINEKEVLKRIDLKLPYNKYICILGHNGSGKSTLSKLLMGLSKPWAGSIKISGIEMTERNISQVLDKIGLIFQNPDSQFIGLTAEDDIAFGLETKNIPRPLAKKIIERVSDYLDIKSILHVNSSELSGGQKQKVCIASVLATNPEIIIFDESTSMLDSKSKREILEIMQNLAKFQNKTVISITHDMEELLLADEVVLMKDGKIIAHDQPKNILSNLDLIKSTNLSLPFIPKLANYLMEKGHRILDFTNEAQLIEFLSKNV